jgi:hypothetical protein
MLVERAMAVMSFEKCCALQHTMLQIATAVTQAVFVPWWEEGGFRLAPE